MVVLCFLTLETSHETTKPLKFVAGLCLFLLLLIGGVSLTQAQTAIKSGTIKHLLKEFSQDGHYQNLTHLGAGVSFRDEANPLTLNYLLATGKRPIVIRFREGEKIQVVQNYILDRRVFVFSAPVTHYQISEISYALGFDDSAAFVYSMISLARRRAGVSAERFDTTRFAQNDVRNLFKKVEYATDRTQLAQNSNEEYTRVSGELWRREERKKDVEKFIQKFDKIGENLSKEIDKITLPKKENSGEYPPRK